MTDLQIDTNGGLVSATLDVPDNPKASLVFAHGAGADHTHAHMKSLAQAFFDVNIATLRFNFPFKEAGRNRVDTKVVATAAIVDTTTVAVEHLDLPLFVGGHSFGGRMATHAVAEGLIECSGMILCSFPLHPAGKPGTQRANHLADVPVPMLFLSGTRDALAERSLLTEVVDSLDQKNQLHWLETADHSYKILKRSRPPEPGVYEEAASVAKDFVSRLL